MSPCSYLFDFTRAKGACVLRDKGSSGGKDGDLRAEQLLERNRKLGQPSLQVKVLYFALTFILWRGVEILNLPPAHR